MSILQIKPETKAATGYEIDRTNKRIIVNSYSRRIMPADLSEELFNAAQKHSLEKIWLWAFQEDLTHFLNCGFKLEGIYADDILRKPAFSLARFVNPKRGISERTEMENEVLAKVKSSPVKPFGPLSDNLSLRLLNLGDCTAISGLLGKVFATYPTPVEDPFYIKKLMQKDCIFAGAFHDSKLIGVAAAYFDPVWLRCEMTDCATLPAYRGQSLTARLLRILEHEVEKRGRYTLYTLARAVSYGMNRTFYKLGYRYQGRLLNNCHIDGRFEDMNLWVKY